MDRTRTVGNQKNLEEGEIRAQKTISRFRVVTHPEFFLTSFLSPSLSLCASLVLRNVESKYFRTIGVGKPRHGIPWWTIYFLAARTFLNKYTRGDYANTNIGEAINSKGKASPAARFRTRECTGPILLRKYCPNEFYDRVFGIGHPRTVRTLRFHPANSYPLSLSLHIYIYIYVCGRLIDFHLFFYLRAGRMNFTKGESEHRTWSDRKEVFFGLSAIRLIDSPMHLTFKAFLNIHPSLECGRNPITREGYKERVLFNRFNWNYFPLSPTLFWGGRRAFLGIFVTIEFSFFFV